MKQAIRNYLLFTDATSLSATTGRWRFLLESLDGQIKLSASDEEPEAAKNRLELMAVVRGLEAIEEESRVTLITPSRYVQRGIAQGLAEWREQDWKWERFGSAVPIRDQDLWQRVDRALEFHRLACRLWRAGEGPACDEDAELSCAESLHVPAASRPGSWNAVREVACGATAPEKTSGVAEEGVLIVRRARPRRRGLRPGRVQGRPSGRFAERVWAMCQSVVRPGLAEGAHAGA